MLKSITAYIIPLLLPAAIYFAYMLLSRRIQLGTGNTAAALRQLPWPWLLGAGLILMAASLFAFGLTSGTDKDGAYIPPQFVDGEMIPGHVE